MKRNAYYPIAFMLVLFSSISWAKPSGSKSNRPQTPVHSELVSVHEVTQSLSLIGKLQSKQYVNIASEVAAKVTYIAVKANQKVKKGQLLVLLDNGKANALLEEAKAYLNDEERKLKEYQRLIKRQAVTQTQLDGQVAVVEIAKARLLAAQVFVNNHRITAPFSGTIGLIDFSLGKMVSVGETLLTLDNLSSMTVDLAVPERYLSQLKVGMPVKATTRAWKGNTFVGKVTAVDSRINPDTLNLRVRMLFENKELKLKPGMMMSAELKFDPIKEPIIPVQALEYSGTKRFVYVINKDSKVERREVILGARIKDEVLIASGLEVGEKVVVKGLVNMRNGLKVKDLNAPNSQSPKKAKAAKDK